MSTMGFSHREHPFFQQLAAMQTPQHSTALSDNDVTEEDCQAIMAGSRGSILLDLNQEKE